MILILRWIRLCPLLLLLLCTGWTTPEPAQMEISVLVITEMENPVQDAPETLQIISESKPTEELLQPCGLTVEELESALKYELKQYAADFIQTESDSGVNAAFLASVAALESGWGRYCADNNNLYGWTDSGGYMAFNSPQECIEYVARNLKENYLSPDGIWFEGYSVESVNVHYNGRSAWEREVRGIMQEIYKNDVDNEMEL